MQIYSASNRKLYIYYYYIISIIQTHIKNTYITIIKKIIEKNML